MGRRGAGPDSARDVWALVMILLMAWCGIAWTIQGLAGLTAGPALALGLVGGAAILAGGWAWARRWRRR